MFKMPEKPTGMILDGVFASENIDSSAERISIKGLDISSFEEGNGTINYEHKNEDDGGIGQETVGKVIYAHKVLKASDCENDRQREYWKMTKETPFLYGVARLFDGAGHRGAQALAAAIRDHVANKEPIQLRWSIEGSTTARSGMEIEKAVARRVALTWKPCNKAAVSGLLVDPNAPEGFGKSEHLDPQYSPLGGSVTLICDPVVEEKLSASLRLLATAAALRTIRKALDAGSAEAAPSARTGGSALAREDLAPRVSAAIRDYGVTRKFRRKDFKDFAKARLPEVSDSFLDHFTDVAEAAHLKHTLAKKERVSKLPKAPGVIIPPRHQAVNHAVPPTEHQSLEDIPEREETHPDERIPVAGQRKLESLTFRGKPLKLNEGMRRPVFDAEKGILHTPAGSIRAYLPEHDGKDAAKNYQKLLSHPDIERAMDTALENHGRLHKLLKAGKLPPEVVMHAVLFSQLSPNKPVPTQEIQYSRLVDAMDATGIDPREPGFEEIEEPYRQLDQPDVLPHVAREEFRRNPSYYTGGKIGVERDSEGNKLGKPSLETGRYPGELLSARPLFQDFLGRASQYHKIHNSVVDLVNRHRHNGLDAVAELMDQKAAAQRAHNTRRAAIKAGKPDPGAYQGLTVPGLKVKTGLYTYGMLGGADSVVPDTHFIRNMYGLDLDKDAPTIEYLKNLHWRPTNVDPVMRPLNEWYLHHHPAVAYTQNHPKWGSQYERPQDALFPAFWRHWLTIQPHEKFVGLPNMSEQAGTTHAPYWEAIRPHVEEALERGEDQDSSVALRTALVHQQYVKDYGEVPAQFLYYHHLVPRLLEAAENRRRVGTDLKFLTKARILEAGLIDLRKAVQDALAGPEEPDVRTVDLVAGGKKLPVGRFFIHGNQLHHLEDYHGVLKDLLPEGPLDAQAVSKLHGLQWSPELSVRRHMPAPPSDESGKPQLPKPPGVVQVGRSELPPPPPVFEYHRPGLQHVHTVEFGPQGAALDGRALTDAELSLMLRNHQQGLATIRHKLPQVSLQKADEESVPEVMDPEDALTYIRAAEAAGHLPKGTSQTWVKHLMTDPMMEGIGNKYAWNRFLDRNKPGVYGSLDINDFKGINDNFGHQAGDAAIVAVGKALRAAADKTKNIKVFRSGGDEGAIFAPTHEDALRFIRYAREHLDSIPPVNGTHKISMSFGLGNNYDAADKALYEAKKQKVDPKTGLRAFPVGRTPHLAHSLVAGGEGPIKMGSEPKPSRFLTGPSGAQNSPSVPEQQSPVEPKLAS